MNLKCAIVDDEPLALGLLESYIKRHLFWNCPVVTPALYKP